MRFRFEATVPGDEFFPFQMRRAGNDRVPETTPRHIRDRDGTLAIAVISNSSRKQLILSYQRLNDGHRARDAQNRVT